MESGCMFRFKVSFIGVLDLTIWKSIVTDGVYASEGVCVVCGGFV